MGCGTDKMWASLCKIMGKEELIDDPSYVTNLKRCDNYGSTLKDIVESWSKEHEVAEIEELAMPDDVFRITRRGIEFVVMDSNSVDREKSAKFTEALTR